MEQVGQKGKVKKLVPSVNGEAKKATTLLLPDEVVKLHIILEMIMKVNNTLKGTVINFIRSNQKTFKKAYEDLCALDEAIDAEYCIVDDKNRKQVWDRNEGGAKGWLEEKDGRFIAVDNEGMEIPMNVSLFPYVEGEERRKEYDAKKAAFNETKVEVVVEKISPSLIKTIEIPMKSFDQQPLNIALFFDNLVNE